MALCSRFNSIRDWRCRLILQEADKLERERYDSYSQESQNDESEHFYFLRFWVGVLKVDTLCLIHTVLCEQVKHDRLYL